jgi:hypothetical protein
VHPATERCSAKSKRSGEPCKRWVKGGGVCAIHGGRAPQVAARREQRILLAEARAKAAPAVAEQVVPASAEEILISLLTDVRETLVKLKAEMATNPSPHWLVLLGDWLDRADRISRTVLVTNAQQRLEARQQQLALTHSEQLLTLIFIAITEADLTASQRVAVLDALFEAMADPDFTVVPPSDIEAWMTRTRSAARAEAAVPAVDDHAVLAALDF